MARKKKPADYPLVAFRSSSKEAFNELQEKIEAVEDRVRDALEDGTLKRNRLLMRALAIGLAAIQGDPDLVWKKEK